MKKVVIGIIKNNEKVIIVKRKEKEGDLLWQFPGGEVENNETDKEAVLREIKEETNLNCKIVKHIGTRIHPNTGREISYWGCEKLTNTIKNSDTDLEDVKWININQLEHYFTTEIYVPIKEFLNNEL